MLDHSTNQLVEVDHRQGRIGFAPAPSLLTQPRGKSTPSKVLFTHAAWTKLLAARDAHDVEVGFLGLTDEKEPFRVVDLIMPKQTCSGTTVKFDADDIADITARLALEGVYPDRFMRIWIHTHPGASAHPSGTDIDTFSDSFANADYAVMLIVGKGSNYEVSCRFRIHTADLFLDKEIPVQYEAPPDPEFVATWLAFVKDQIQRPQWGGQEIVPWSPAQSINGNSTAADSRGGSDAALALADDEIAELVDDEGTLRALGMKRVMELDTIIDDLFNAWGTNSPARYNHVFEKYKLLSERETLYAEKYALDEYGIQHITSAGLY